MYVLVKNYGSEGLIVCGLVCSESTAIVWQSADSCCDYITVETDGRPNSLGISPNLVLQRN